MQEVTLRVPGIHCAGCIESIRMGLRALKGVQEVQGSDRERTVTVRFDPAVLDLEGLRRALARMGYDRAEPVEVK